ncbi:globin domain-containing protein [Stieleria sp. ICT_E10.1]|uniref:globin domain-containing protein n=1 Tax=Stieleria sedimenti TaxID=2976331 RepID=UPI00217FA41C|nr:globin domain-containing protein [Stieleria sedimenti]MCS7466527.1 globin domain-containing protein [Stieleria sedimenti]
MELEESVEAILSDDSIALDGFYDRLFKRYPEFKYFFAGANVKRQTAMLTMALLAVKQYPALRRSSQAYLEVLGTKHHGLGITNELFPKFIEVLVETIAEFHGSDWNAALDKQWTDALNYAAAIMHRSPHD